MTLTNDQTTSLEQPWRKAWPQKQDMQTKEHVISYGFMKGTKMSVDGSAGHGKKKILYDTEDSKST